jgi:glycosyltransferase involved in cell wall biosynthesis
MKDLHICLKMAGLNWNAGIIYIQNLVQALASLPEEEIRSIKLSVIVGPNQKYIIDSLQANTNQIFIEYFIERLIYKVSRGLAEKIPFIPLKVLNRHGFDFVYPDLTGRPAPYLFGGWIPDFQHLYLPELFSSKEIDLRNATFKKIAQNSPVVILSSQMAQADFFHLFPEAASRSRVLNFVSWINPDWLKIDPIPIQEKYELPDKFFLISNQFWKHKNHGIVFETLGILKKRGIQPVVVCTGGLHDYRHPDYYDQLIDQMKELAITPQVKILGHIPRVDQIQLMRRSLAVIQPSLFEGWSTVVEDAKALGKPMIISDFPVHLEQDPPASFFYERHNSEMLSLCLEQSLSSLIPGPIIEEEQDAQQRQLQRYLIFGRGFLEIVRRVCN